METLCIILFFLPTCWSSDAPEKVSPSQESITAAAVIEKSAPVTADTPLIGRTFIGPPVSRKMKGILDCEGCSEPGTLNFNDEKFVGFIWRGSDIRDSGTYTVKDGLITVKSTLYNAVHVFKIRPNGTEIVHEKSGAVFRDKRYPW